MKGTTKGLTEYDLYACLIYLGGFVYVMRQPDCNFWDGLIWPYYVGRFIAVHFALLH